MIAFGHINEKGKVEGCAIKDIRTMVNKTYL